jgi:hypothetical protein
VHQNLKKRFAYLARFRDEEKKEIYSKIINLPFYNYEKQFEDAFKEIIDSEVLSEDQEQYLKKRYECRHIWAKCFMKHKFCAGMSTTSRIEAKHRVYKQYLNSGSQLTQLFQTFRALEENEMSLHKEEIETITKSENKKLGRFEVLKFFENKLSKYTMYKLKDELLESVNYSVRKDSSNNNLWYIVLDSFKFSRLVERGSVIHKVKQGKIRLECDCGDPIFVGLPCRHLLARATSQNNFNFKLLPWNRRWSIDYYQHSEKLLEPQELSMPSQDELKELLRVHFPY